MKKLNTFYKFDYNTFLEGKELTVADVKYYDGSQVTEGKTPFIGIKLSVVITRDDTCYPNRDGGYDTGLNLYEKFTVRIHNASREDANSISLHDNLEITNVTNCMVLGDYKNMLVIDGEIELVE